MQMIPAGPQPRITSTHARTASAFQPQVVTNYKDIGILTYVDILAAGLRYAGFDTRHQGKVNLNPQLCMEN
jgi:hypothetical protein